MTAPTADATMEREIAELETAFIVIADRPEFWQWAKREPEAAADWLGLGGRVRWAFLFVLSGEVARAPATPDEHHRAFWRS